MFSKGQILTDNATLAMRIERIAPSTMGVVLMGPNLLPGVYDVGRWYVLKTINADMLHRYPYLRDRFIREALIWQGVWPHPNIALAQSILEIQGMPFIQLEYAEQGDLRTMLQKPLPLATRMAWSQHIATGLWVLHTPDYLHLRDFPIIHRDLKPENILIDARGSAMITDFGLVDLLDNNRPRADYSEALSASDDLVTANATVGFHTVHGTVIGTAAYMAPEQWEGVEYTGLPADIYACGVTLCELLIDYPYEVAPIMTSEAWKHLHQTAAPQKLRARADAFPPMLTRLLEAMLEKKTTNRPTITQVTATMAQCAEEMGLPPYRLQSLAFQSERHECTQWTNWAIAYRRFELYDGALERLERAERTEATNIDMLITYGNVFLNMQRWSEAEKKFRQALQLCEEHDIRHKRIIYNALGVLYNEQRRFAAADAAFAQALALGAKDASVWLNRAHNQYRWGVARRYWFLGGKHFTSSLRYAKISNRLAHNDAEVKKFITVVQEELTK